MFRNSFESKKHKLKSKALNKNEESGPSSLSRQRTTSCIVTSLKPAQTSQSLKKALEQMSSEFTEQRQMREALEEKVNLVYTRSIQRQRQFQALLQETIPFCKKQQKIPMTSQAFSQIHQKILMFFEESNQSAQNKLTLTATELEDIMDRKIRSITDHMQKQLQKSKKLLKLNHQTIEKEIKQIISLSHEILDENDSFRKMNHQLTLKNEILRGEKKMLISENLEKKQLILKLFEELKEKYKKDDLINEEIMVLKKQRKQVEKQYQDYQREIRSKFDNSNQIRAKSIYAFRTEDNFVTIPQKKSRPTSKCITTECSYNMSCQSTGKRQSKTKPQSRLVTTIEVRNSCTSKSFYPNKTQTIATEDLLFQKEDEKVKELRSMLRNERKKNSDLTKQLNQKLVYQLEMDNLLKDLFLNEEQKVSEDPSVFKKSGKIYHMIKELGRRLMSSANPVVNSGFNDLDNLLEEMEKDKN